MLDNTHITELIIPDNVTTLENYILANAFSLKRIEIGSGVTNLSPSFKNFSGAPIDIEVTIDDNNPTYEVQENLILTNNGKEVVTFIKHVESQIIPEGIEKIGTYAFENFNLAKEIILPNTLKEIDSYSFIYCTGITEITIPNSVNTFGTNIFANCSNLEYLKIDKARDSAIGAPWGAPKGERVIIWLR